MKVVFNNRHIPPKNVGDENSAIALTYREGTIQAERMLKNLPHTSEFYENIHKFNSILVRDVPHRVGFTLTMFDGNYSGIVKNSKKNNGRYALLTRFEEEMAA